MLKKILPVLVILAIFLSGCGPQGTPTLSPADVEGTAVSSAWTMVAMTQLAIPTATPVPPTETPSPTPLPTETPIPSPTLGQNFQPTATQAAGGECLGPINMAEAGPTVPIRIENETDGTITVISLNLRPNAFGQCGAISVSNIAKNGKVVVNLPKGSWYAGAFVALKGGGSSSPWTLFELRPGDDDLLRLVVRQDQMLLKP